MSLPTAPLPDPTHASESSRPPTRRLRVRRIVALVAAGGLLAGVVGVSSVATTRSTTPAAVGSGSVSTQAWGGDSTGTSPWVPTGRGRYGSGAGSSGSTSSSTVDSQTATATQSTGVALIDTVLTNGEAAGTGIVLTSDGELLTNYHVVADSTLIKVTIASTGATYTGTVVGADPTADVALLQLKNATGLTVAAIDDDTVRLGDAVTAVGNAGGTGALSAADGTITDLSTQITTADETGVSGETLEGVLETSSDVVAGDSGGPLLDSQGEVIGIDTAASTGTEINGYAVPIDDALAVVRQIRSGTETTAVRIGPAAFLGVQLGATTAYGSPGQAGGATVAGVVDGGAAARLGIGGGDTVTRIGSTEIGSASALSAAVALRNPGDRVRVTWVTAEGTVHSGTVTLGSSPVN
ncbi:MAG: Serine protease, subfamily, contains C-terminal domain [Friedmanniella sp.]|nr:Serine protease, subfamily, contains C-terminal domain [Friedmanniella sp.]